MAKDQLEGDAKDINKVVRNAILKLCETNSPYLGDLEVDGIICISGSKESEQIVVKVHEKLFKHKVSENHVGETELSESYHSMLMSANKGNTPNSEATKERPRSYLNTSKDGSLDVGNGKINGSCLTSPQHPISIKTEHDNIGLDDSPTESTALGYNSSMLSDSYLSVTSPVSSPFTNVHARPSYFISQLPIIPECKQCGFTFAQIELLQEHNEAVHGVYTCRFCYRTFTSRSNLDRHLRLHTGQKPYSCKKCGKSFSRKDHLSNHAAKHAYKCGQCHKRYGDRQQLDTHYSMDHRTSLIALCTLCNKGFHDNVAYQDHQKAHPGSKVKLSNILEVPFTCHVCSYKTSQHLNLLKHKLVHNPGHTNYRCLGCLRVFSDPVLYSEHFDDHRADTNIFECCICRRIQNTLNRLRTHEKEHLEGRPASRPYSLCSPALTDYPGPLISSGLYGSDSIGHGWMSSTDDMACTCPYCTVNLSSSTAMLEHIAQKHQYSGARNLKEDFSSSDEQEDILCTPSPIATRDVDTPNNIKVVSDIKSSKEDTICNKDIIVPNPSRVNSTWLDSPGSEIMYVEPSSVDSPHGVSATSSPMAEVLLAPTPLTVHRLEMKRSHSPENYRFIRSSKLVPTLMPKRSRQRRIPTQIPPQPVIKPCDDIPDELQDITLDQAHSIDHGEPHELTHTKKNTPDKGRHKELEHSIEELKDNNKTDEVTIKTELNDDDYDSQTAVDYLSLAHNHSMLYNLPPSYTMSSLFSGTSPVLQAGSLSSSSFSANISSSLSSNLAPSFLSGLNSGGLGGVKNDLPSLFMSAEQNGFINDEPTQSRPGSSDSLTTTGTSLNDYLPIAEPEDRLTGDIPPLASSPTPPLYNNNFDPVALDGSSIRTRFMCDVCGHRMDGFDVFAKHCFLAHLRYPCVYCSKTFAQKANRERHMCIHTGSRPYQCRQCGERFSRGDKLKHHRLKYHQTSKSEVGK